MKRLVLITLLLCSSIISSLAQVDHWESVVLASDTWKYFPGVSNPGAAWNTSAFNDAAWSSGPGGFGYGDGDDGTTLAQPVLSVFLRTKFTITDLSKIDRIRLYVDYDDGFAVYINGVEVARNFLNANAPFDQPATGLHEAVLYTGGVPEFYDFTATQFAPFLVNGQNTIAVQVHNENVSSSDLTSNVFLMAGMKTAGTTYRPLPSWFPQTNFTSSNLPIIKINTNGQPIPDEPFITAQMGVIDNGVGNTNNVDDIPNGFEGRIEIETRGESSQALFPKKSYRVETIDAVGNPLNVALLGMPPENDWVLYAPYTDKTMMRDVLAYKMGRDLGRYAPRTRYVELVVNGEYMGVYVLIERIKIDKNRVDIATLQPTDLTGEELTGGYLLRVDKWDGNDYPAWVATPTPTLPGENNITFQFFDPDGEDLAPAQQQYIINFIQQMQSSLTHSGFPVEGNYETYIDPDAFIDFMIVNEISKNIDGYVFSTYMYKEKSTDGGKLKMGPLWDFNLAFGNVDYLQNSQTAPGWTYNDGYRMFWFRRLMQDPKFAAKMKCRWTQVRSTLMTNSYFTGKIDSIANVLSQAQARNYQRWKILGTYVWPNQYVGQTYADETNFLKNWILERLAWMDANMPGDCSIVTSVADDKPDVAIYPNPSPGSFVVELQKPLPPNSVLRVFTPQGSEVFVLDVSGRMRIEPAPQLQPGIYFITIQTTEGLLVSEKLAIR